MSRKTMKELIDKAEVVREIEKLSAYLDCLHEQRIIEKILSIIDTLEVKEVDLEKEIKSWLDHGHITDTRYDDYDDNDIESTAKHFFELGLKAQKGE